MRGAALLAGLLLVGCGSSADGGGEDTAAGGAPGAGGTPSDLGSGREAAGGTSALGGAGAGNGGTIGVAGNGGRGGGASSDGGAIVGKDGASDGGGTQDVGGGATDGGARCAANTKLPSGAPALTAGTWVNISPVGVPFDAKATALTQGMALDPCDMATIYLTVDSPGDKSKTGLYKTVDAGAHWTKLGKFGGLQNIKVDPRDHTHLYVTCGVGSGTDGFWVSKDAGETWTQPSGFLTAASQLTCCDLYHAEPDPTDFNHVLVTFHYGDGILESFNGGDTWTVHKPDPGWSGSGGYDVFMLYRPDLGLGNGKRWLYGTQGKGYWLTTDAGSSWNKVTDTSMEHGGGQLYYNKQGTLYSSGTPHVIRSTDNGATWTALASSPQSTLSMIGDGTYLYTGSHGGGAFFTARESADDKWTAFNSQTFWEGPFEMAFDAANGILYAANIRAGIWALKVK
jgi:hypothetical protein